MIKWWLKKDHDLLKLKGKNFKILRRFWSKECSKKKDEKHFKSRFSSSPALYEFREGIYKN